MRTIEQCREHPKYSKIPEHTIWTINQYIEIGQPPGDFVQALMEDRLVASFGSADEKNIAAMFEIADYLYNHVPLPARGSAEKVTAWLERHASAREAKKND